MNTVSFQLQSVYKIMDQFCDFSDEIKNHYKVKPPDVCQGYVPAGVER